MGLPGACGDIAGPFAGAGLTGGASVVEGICQYFSADVNYLQGILAEAQAHSVNTSSPYVPGGPLPDWVTALPEIIFNEPGWTFWLYQSLKTVGFWLGSHPWDTLTLEMLVTAIVRQLRNNDESDGQPLPYEGGDEDPYVQHRQPHEEGEVEPEQDNIAQPAIDSY